MARTTHAAVRPPITHHAIDSTMSMLPLIAGFTVLIERVAAAWHAAARPMPRHAVPALMIQPSSASTSGGRP